MTSTRLLSALLCLALAPACSSDDSVSSDAQARRAYLGLDKSIGKSIALGFDGFNTSSSANISPQMTAGDAGGMLVITGQVDHGSSANKNMRLYVGMTAYTDGIFKDGDTDVAITYATDTTQTAQPFLSMMLSGIPTGTVTGTLVGTYHMTGDLADDAMLNLSFTGQLQAGANNTVERKPGTTMVTGTATSGAGTYNVMVTL